MRVTTQAHTRIHRFTIIAFVWERRSSFLLSKKQQTKYFVATEFTLCTRFFVALNNLPALGH